MTRTSGASTSPMIVEGRATGYSRLPSGQFGRTCRSHNVIGNGGLLSTRGDFLTLECELDNPVSAASHGRSPADRGAERRVSSNEYALGLTVTDYRASARSATGDRPPAIRPFWARWPDEKLSVVVLCNTGGTNPASTPTRWPTCSWPEN